MRLPCAAILLWARLACAHPVAPITRSGGTRGQTAIAVATMFYAAASLGHFGDAAPPRSAAYQRCHFLVFERSADHLGLYE